MTDALMFGLEGKEFGRLSLETLYSPNLVEEKFSELERQRRVGTLAWYGMVLESAPIYPYHPTKSF
jgi:hypothetical protein